MVSGEPVGILQCRGIWGAQVHSFVLGRHFFDLVTVEALGRRKTCRGSRCKAEIIGEGGGEGEMQLPHPSPTSATTLY